MIGRLLVGGGRLRSLVAVGIALSIGPSPHLAHAQQVRSQPRELLRGIPGLQ